LLKELVIGFLVALGISSYLAGTNGVDPSNGWGLPPTTAGGQGPDLIDEVNAGTFQGEVLDSSIPCAGGVLYPELCPLPKHEARAGKALAGEPRLSAHVQSRLGDQPLTSRKI
jgi:hypothetical protein